MPCPTLRPFAPNPARLVSPAYLHLATAIFLAIVVITAAASTHAQELTLVPEPSNGEFRCPEILTVDLTIDSAVSDLQGFSLVLDYDPAILEPVAVSAGTLVDQASCGHSLHWLDPGDNDGSLVVDLALLGCLVEGPGVVLTLQFQGLGEGSTNLDCSQSVFRDSINDDIPVLFAPIAVTYSCPVSTETQTWGVLKQSY